jgi:hypothetical protein
VREADGVHRVIALIAIASMVVAQSPVPQAVVDEGVKSFERGDAWTALVISIIVNVIFAGAIVYLFKALRSSDADSRAHERESNAKTVEVTGGLGQALKDSAQATKETAAALNAQNVTLAKIATKVGA